VALYYLEMSALVKLYVYELGTERLLALTSGHAGHRFAILSIAQVEFRSPIRRRQRGVRFLRQLPTSWSNRFGGIRRASFSSSRVLSPCSMWRWR
jgi:hypothetical protein